MLLRAASTQPSCRAAIAADAWEGARIFVHVTSFPNGGRRPTAGTAVAEAADRVARHPHGVRLSGGRMSLRILAIE